MPAESYFQLLNPLMFLVFAAGLYSIHAVRPTRATLMFALSYTVGAAAFLIEFFNMSGMRILPVVPTVSLYAITAILVSGAMMLRYRKWAPWGLLVTIGAAHMGVYAWFREVEQIYWIASMAANFGCGLIFSVAAVGIRNHIRRPIDRVLYGLYLVSCLQCFVRPVALVLLAPGPLNPSNLDQPLAILMLHLFVGACAVMLGMTLIIAKILEVYRELQEQSVTDRLSGVLNRRGFEIAAEEAFSRRSGDLRFACVVIADIDGFKSINDAHGHAFGDMVITEFGALFSDYAVGDRIAARLGGDEFVMLLPGEMTDVAIEIADAIRRDFEQVAIAGPGGPARLSASFGVALRQPDETVEKLIARADEALYLAKTTGRGRVCSETDVAVDRLGVAADRLARRRLRDAIVHPEAVAKTV